MNNYLLLFVLLVNISVHAKIIMNDFSIIPNQAKNDSIWYYLDMEKDSVPGISLNKTYDSLLKNKKGREIIVALIDNEIDINHEDLKGQIWINPVEKPGNGIDDDNNGYVDDIHGWNFLGNSKGENVLYATFETTRILRKYKFDFDNISKEKVKSKDQENYINYLKAKEKYKKQYNDAVSSLEVAENIVADYFKAKDTLKPYFPDGKFTLEKLEKIDTSGNNLYPHIKLIKRVLFYGVDEKKMANGIESRKKYLNYYLNLDYDDRKIMGDNSDSLDDINYGNNNISGNIKILDHGTRVSGIMVAHRNNNLGIKGISNNIKLISLCVSPIGDENDKDIALAIRYAVNNGAKIINMSSSKTFSLHSKWVTEALEYAAANDVLFIRSAGNSNMNLDDNATYPTPKHNPGKGIEDMFILVGASGPTIDQNLKARFSNYGKNTVDIFAPGVDIYTTQVENTYIKDSGTSLAAPMVSGVVSLIRSQYPGLTAKQVKKIILESGTSYDTIVEIEDDEDTIKKVPFSELSKSGKILNAYNALRLAEKMAHIK